MTEKNKKDISAKAKAWLTQSNFDDNSLTLLTQACHFTESLANQKEVPLRETLIEQGIAIASELQHLKCDSETLSAALVYPSFLHSRVLPELVTKTLNNTITKLLVGTKRMEIIDVTSPRTSTFSQQRNLIDNIRKMLLAMVDDIRIVLIKLAERLVHLRYLQHQSEIAKKEIAKKAMDVYAPLANRLGIGQFKWQMEDWAFRYLHPNEHADISKHLNMQREERDAYVQSVIADLKKLLPASLLEKVEINGRAKHIYSIYRKMNRKRVGINEIYDVSAVRILVPSIEDCYTVLSLIHATWLPIRKEFDDYIAKPKPNGYRSIHTAIVGPDDRHVEIQIRTFDMDAEAELGVAAHWQYKEGKKFTSSYEEKINWLRELVDWQKEVSGSGKSRDSLYQKIFEDRVYVFTPNGDVLDLEAGATALDFAYHIHTDVGHRCRGAKINGIITPLTHPLKTGDRVEILTAKTGHPSRDWLNPEAGYLKTHHARAKVHHWFRKENYAENLATGEAIWEKTYSKIGFSKNALGDIYKQFNLKSAQDLLAAIGANDISIKTIINRLRSLTPSKAEKIETELPIQRSTTLTQRDTGSFISIEGVGNLLTQLAQCCQPIPGDPIIGYITKGHGITVHHHDCHNIQQAIKFRSHRVITVDWGATPQRYPVTLLIEADDRPGLIRDISNILASENIPILGLNTRVNKLENRAHINLTIEIKNLEWLDKTIKHLEQVPEVILVKRY